MSRCPVAVLLVLTFPLLGALTAVSARSVAADGLQDETRALWVVRDSITTPASIEQLVTQAVSHGFNTLFVQVRGRGDAYFAGGLEPRAEALTSQPASFDPLGLTLRVAHAAGLKVHAWVSINLVSSATWLPSSPEHVVNRHPEWLMVPRALAQDLAGTTPQGPGYVGKLARWTRGQEGVEGLYVSPIVPAAARYTVAVIADLVQRYEVDGVHLDYLRYPAEQFDYSRPALQEFAEVVAPTLDPARRRALAAQARGDVLAWVDANPERWADFRRSRLTALVMRLRTAIRTARPGALVSAAVVPDPQVAFSTRLQDWRLWAEAGLLDVLCPMAYTTDGRVFRSQIEEAVRLTAPSLVWAGIGSYRLTPSQTVANIAAAREAGAAGIVLFSYDAITGGASETYLDTVRRTAFGSGGAGRGSVQR